MSAEDEVLGGLALSGIGIDVRTYEAGRLSGDQCLTVSRFPVVSLLAEQFAITVAPAFAWETLGGSIVHTSSQSSAVTMSSGIFVQRNRILLPNGIRLSSPLYTSGFTGPGLKWRSS